MKPDPRKRQEILWEPAILTVAIALTDQVFTR